MDYKLNSHFFTDNWQRKLVALITGLILWLFVNSSITEQKTISNIPVRIINLPADQTIEGLLPNRLLRKRITLTLNGTKDVIQDLEPSDLEVVLDASTVDSKDWVVKIGKKNLVSLNPSIDLLHYITQVTHSEFVLKMSPLVSLKIPIVISVLAGEAPNGYKYLDFWPQVLMQNVSGSEEEIRQIKEKGLELVLNLSEITQSDLDNLATPQTSYGDEVSFLIPAKWQKVRIPDLYNITEEINDPEGQNLHVNFLKRKLVPLNREVSVSIFYPLKNINTINPLTFSLAPNELIQKKNELFFLSTPLYAMDVSYQFLQVVQDNFLISIVALPKNEREVLPWSWGIVNIEDLENLYVSFMLAQMPTKYFKKREAMLRARFKNYKESLVFYTSPEHKLSIESSLSEKEIKINSIR